MPDRFCPNCGTEVDEDARFCPTCGQTLLPFDEAEGSGAGDEIPAAPAWREPAEEPTRPSPTAPEPESPPSPPAPQAAPDAPSEAAEPQPAHPARADEGGGRQAAELPFTLPTTVAGWLIGAGTGFGALALLPLLGSVLNVLLFLALLGVCASVFLADRLPDVPRLRVLTLVVVMVALGVALDRAAFTVSAVNTIFLFAILVAAGGVILVEFDRDRPLPPPGAAGG